jgi:microcystin-dependent protein
MAQPYIGEIRMFAGNFAPVGWMFCDGQLLPISENETLFALIGTTYGGDGESTFALPNLQSRVPIHQGPNNSLATSGGVEEVTLTVNQIPSHNHAFLAFDATSNSPNPAGSLIGRSTQVDAFFDVNPTVAMNAGMVGSVGGSQPHENMQPFLCVNYIISLFGIFPQQS